jgi:hypothetical protein
MNAIAKECKVELIAVTQISEKNLGGLKNGIFN